MRNTFTRKEFALAVACALALGVFSEIALAQARDVNEHALLLDSRGEPVMSQFGLCWHTGFGPAPQWTRGCHAEVAAPVAQYFAPAAAAALPVYEKVAFDADVLFDSGRSELRPAARTTLDQFVAGIHGLDAQSIAAVGYAAAWGRTPPTRSCPSNASTQ